METALQVLDHVLTMPMVILILGLTGYRMFRTEVRSFINRIGSFKAGREGIEASVFSPLDKELKSLDQTPKSAAVDANTAQSAEYHESIVARQFLVRDGTNGEVRGRFGIVDSGVALDIYRKGGAIGGSLHVADDGWSHISLHDDKGKVRMLLSVMMPTDYPDSPVAPTLLLRDQNNTVRLMLALLRDEPVILFNDKDGKTKNLIQVTDGHLVLQKL